MGKEKDIAEKILADHQDVFADIVNVLLFQGKRLILPPELLESKSRSMYKADGKLHEQERDVLKYWKRGKSQIALLGLEHQTDEDKDMILRVIAYNGAGYRNQLRRGKKQRYPVITLVLYFGLKPWKGARTLSERVQIPEEMKAYVDEQKLNLFEIAFLTDEQVQMFQSDFRIVADYFVQLRKNGNYVPSRETIKHVDEVLKLMTVLTGDTRFSEAQEDWKGEKVTMCEVLDRVENRGIEKGIEKGIEVFVLDNQEEGIPKARIISKMVRRFGIDQNQAEAYYDKYAVVLV